MAEELLSVAAPVKVTMEPELTDISAAGTVMLAATVLFTLPAALQVNSRSVPRGMPAAWRSVSNAPAAM